MVLVYFHSKDALSRDFRVSFCHLSFPPGLLMNKQNGLCVCVCVKIRKKYAISGDFVAFTLCCIYVVAKLLCGQTASDQFCSIQLQFNYVLAALGIAKRVQNHLSMWITYRSHLGLNKRQCGPPHPVYLISKICNIFLPSHLATNNFFNRVTHNFFTVSLTL